MAHVQEAQVEANILVSTGHRDHIHVSHSRSKHWGEAWLTFSWAQVKTNIMVSHVQHSGEAKSKPTLFWAWPQLAQVKASCVPCPTVRFTSSGRNQHIKLSHGQQSGEFGLKATFWVSHGQYSVKPRSKPTLKWIMANISGVQSYSYSAVTPLLIT
jgi:hypothetical protein